MLLNSKNKRPQSAFPLRKPSTSFSGLENAKKVNIESGEFNNIPLLENKDTIRNMVDVKTNSILVKVSGEPPLLVELKRFIRNELKELNAECSPVGDQTRLSVYKHAFQSFLKEFKTYRAFLSEIKQEYDQHIDNLYLKLDKIPQLECQLALHKYEASAQHKKMVMDLVVHSEELKQDRENMQKELKKWENEALQSKQRLSGIDDEIKNKNARLKEGEVYITQLLETENMHTQSISTLEDKLATQLEGIQELKRENALLSESLKASQQKIEEIKKQYKDTVPKYEHELLLAEYTSYKSRFEQQQDLTMKMHQQILETQKKHEQFLRELEKRFAERLKYAAPDWDFISKRCAGNLEAVWGPCNGMNCNETIVTLIQMLSRGTSNSLDTANDKLPLVPHTDSVADAKNDRSLTNLKLLELKDEKQTYFLGLGVSANIPRYLRGKGRIRNRCLSRKSCALLIRDIWSEKTKFDIEKKLQGKPSSLGHFLYLYLSKRFTSQGLIVEWGYNLTEACKLHKNYLTDCWVFLDILEEKLDESVYYHLVKVLEDFKTTLIKIDASINDGIASGIIPKTDLFLKLKEIWKYKTTKQIHELQTALDADQSGSKVTYRWMFQNEVESAFLEAIKMQEMEDRAKYLHDLETAILQYHSATMTALTSIEFSRIIGRFDVDKKKSDIDVYVARGFNNLVEKIKPRDAMTIAKFLANISKGVLYRG